MWRSLCFFGCLQLIYTRRSMHVKMTVPWGIGMVGTHQIESLMGVKKLGSGPEIHHRSQIPMPLGAQLIYLGIPIGS